MVAMLVLTFRGLPMLIARLMSILSFAIVACVILPYSCRHDTESESLAYVNCYCPFISKSNDLIISFIHRDQDTISLTFSFGRYSGDIYKGGSEPKYEGESGIVKGTKAYLLKAIPVDLLGNSIYCNWKDPKELLDLKVPANFLLEDAVSIPFIGLIENCDPIRDIFYVTSYRFIRYGNNILVTGLRQQPLNKSLDMTICAMNINNEFSLSLCMKNIEAYNWVLIPAIVKSVSLSEDCSRQMKGGRGYYLINLNVS
jgi:hypothetical protein